MQNRLFTFKAVWDAAYAIAEKLWNEGKFDKQLYLSAGSRPEFKKGYLSYIELWDDPTNPFVGCIEFRSDFAQFYMNYELEES